MLPELTVSLRLRERVQQWLAEHRHSLRLIVPGSFHRQIDDKTRHEAVMLDRYGDPVLRHHKLRPMLVLDQAAATPDRRDVIEDIQAGDTLNVLPSPVGLLCIAICLDFATMRSATFGMR